MAKERFLIIAQPATLDCFARFSETANCERIDAGIPSDDPYAWIEATFELILIRHREATHICSFTPSAHYVFLQNAFVGIPNAAWEYDGDPDALESENGGEWHGYTTYRDDYDRRFIVDKFTVDTVRDLDLRKPRASNADAMERYHSAIWEAAEEAAADIRANGLHAPILDVFTYRQWERERCEAIRRRACERSRTIAARAGLLTL